MTHISKSYTFSNGTTADANQVNQDFDALFNLVNGGLDDTNISAGSLSQAIATEAVTPAKSKGLAYATDLFTNSFIFSGGVPTKDGTNANTIDVPAYVAYIKQTDGTSRRLTTSSTTFVTNVANGTFYLDLNPDGTFSWAGTHSTQTGYITICTVVADASSNVSTITDTRPTQVNLLGGSVGQKLLGNVYPMYGVANLLRPSIANFVRNSVAWRRNFSQVVANQLRTEMGAMGDAPYIEESTSNLLTPNQSNVETDTTGFTANATGTTLSRDTSTGNYLEGAASLKSVCDGTITAQGFYAGITASATTQYTASVWLKGSGTVTLSLSGAGITTVTSSPITLTSNWTRYTIAGTTNASGGALNLVVATNSAQAVTFWADALQIEQKAYATSFITGGTTRNADSFSYTLHAPLPSRWFGALKWIPDQASTVALRNGGAQLLFTTDSTGNPLHRIAWLNGTFKFSKQVGGTEYINQTSTITFNAGDTITLLFEDDPVTTGQMILWVGVNGGVLQQFTLNDTHQITTSKNVYIGCFNTGGYEANGTVEPLLTTTIPTTEQLNWLYNAPLWGQGNFPAILPLQNPQWIAPVLQNGWVNYGSGYSSAAYKKDTNGFVQLTGTVKSGTTTAGTVIFQLPVGYRPLTTKELAAISNNGSSDVLTRINVWTDGTVAIYSGSNSWLSLDNIKFPLDQ